MLTEARVSSRQSGRNRLKVECGFGEYTEVVPDQEIQIVSNEAGEPTAVIVPIELWREIASERETGYLLKSATMKRRLLLAAQRTAGMPLDIVLEKLGL